MNPTATFTATELSKVKDSVTGTRDRYGVFTLSASTNVNNYRLAVKKASDPAPSAAEMESGHHIKRNLSTTPIHVLIAHYLNAPILTWAKTDNWDNSKLPANIYISNSDNFAMNDASLPAANQWVNQSLLAQSTAHKLYGMQEGGSVVQELLTFRMVCITPVAALPAFLDGGLGVIRRPGWPPGQGAQQRPTPKMLVAPWVCEG